MTYSDIAEYELHPLIIITTGYFTAITTDVTKAILPDKHQDQHSQDRPEMVWRASRSKPEDNETVKISSE